MKRWALMATLLFALLNCRSNDSDNSVKPIHGEALAGTWLLYERGYSPGSGYIIEKIPAKPEQTLTFTADGKLHAQGDGLKYYQSFSQFRLDTLNTAVRIHYSPSETNYSEGVYLKNDTLKLYQPCIEGCHSGFVRIK